MKFPFYLPGHPDFDPSDWFLGGITLSFALIVAVVIFGNGFQDYYYGKRQADGSRLNGHWPAHLIDE